MANTSLNMEENIEGALCYILTWVTGLVFYLLEKDSEFVRFHARQSIATFLPLTVLGFIVSWIPFLGWFLGGLIWLLTFILWLVLMIKAYQGEKFKLPIVGDIAERGF